MVKVTEMNANEIRQRLEEWLPCPPGKYPDEPVLRRLVRDVIAFLEESGGLNDGAAYSLGDAIMGLSMIAKGNGNPEVVATSIALALKRALEVNPPVPPSPTTPAPSIADLKARLDSELMMRRR